MGEERGQRRHDLAGLGVGNEARRRDDLAAGHVSAPGVVNSAARLAATGAGRPRARLVDRQRHRVLAEAFLRDEGLGGVDQLLQVLEPVLAFAVGLVEVDQARGLEHVDDDLAQGQAARRLAHRVDPGDEGAEVGAALAGDRADALVEAAAAGPRRVLQLLEGARADAARREVHHPQEAGVVVRVLDQPQVRERMLDLGPLEEAQAAVDLVRDVRR